MSICPFATQRLLPESHTQTRIVPRAVILHSAASKGSLYNFFLKSSNLESHFWVSEKGVIEQYVDTEVRADANLNANSFAVSIETESTVAATERWTPEQAAAIVKLTKWICDTHKIPKKLIDTAYGSGIGWHIQFRDWHPKPKSCPGPARIKQTKEEIIPAVAKGAPAPKPVKKPGELTMSDIATILKRLDAQDKILKQLTDDYLTKGKGVRQVIAETDKRTKDIASGLRPGK